MMKIAAILTSAAIACAPRRLPGAGKFRCPVRSGSYRLCAECLHALPHTECVLRL